MLDLYTNAGSKLQGSSLVTDKSLFHLENVYYIPNYHVKGHVCRTNLPSNSAFRGFGAPQSMFVMENIITVIATKLNLPPNEVSV